MTSISRSNSSKHVTMVSLGARLYLLSMLLIGGITIIPAVSSPTADPPADHESILHALRFQGMTASADALDNIIWNRAFMVLANATLFFPMNDAMAPVAASLNVTELIKLLSYHIVTESLPLRRLTQLPVGTLLKTMVANTSLVVTENMKTLMTINNREVMPKDLCTISTVACYAVKEVLLMETGEKSFDVSVVATVEAPILPPSGLSLPPLAAPVVSPVDFPVGAPVPTEAPTVSSLPESPEVVPVPARMPTMSPPLESPGIVPVLAGAPVVIILPIPGSPEGALLSPGEATEGAPSAAMTTKASIVTLVAVVVLTISVL